MNNTTIVKTPLLINCNSLFMKSLYDYPKNPEQVNEKGRTIKTLIASTLVSQIVSGVTEFSCFLAVLLYKTGDMFQSVSIALLLTFILEGGQRITIPDAARVLVAKKFSGLEKVWSLAICAAALLLFILSTLSSTITVEGAIKATDNTQLISRDSLDNIKKRQRAEILTDYQRDSTSLVQHFAIEISAMQTSTKAKQSDLERRKSMYEDREKKERRKYTSKINEINATISANETTGQQTVSRLESEKANELAGLLQFRQAKLDAIADEHKTAMLELKRKNKIIEKSSSDDNFWYSFLGIIIIIFNQLWLVIVYTLNAIFEELSGMKRKTVIEQHDLQSNPFAHIYDAMTGYLGANIRSLAVSIEGATPQLAPAQPVAVFRQNLQNRVIDVEHEIEEKESIKLRGDDIEGEIIDKERKRKRKRRKKSNRNRNDAQPRETQGFQQDFKSIEEVQKEIARVGSNRRAWKSKIATATDATAKSNCQRNFDKYDKELEKLKVIKVQFIKSTS